VLRSLQAVNVLSDIEIAQSMLAKGEGSEQGQQKQVRHSHCDANVWTVLNALHTPLLGICIQASVQLCYVSRSVGR
jgi:hypothetical protein